MRLGMTGLSPALREAAARLEGVSDTPRLDAELLMAHALGVERSRDAVAAGGFDGAGGVCGAARAAAGG